MADNQRIEDLRRRVQKDPASIAFAQLAEECRRAARFQEAVDVCRTGLELHPAYLSARVTLGRALIELNQHDEAQVELEHVLKNAPENLAAIRGLAEIHHRRGSLVDALAQYRAALALARNDPDLQQTVAELERAVEPPKPPASADGLSFEQAQTEFLKNLPLPPALPQPADAVIEAAPPAAAVETEAPEPLEPAPAPKPWDPPAAEPKPWDPPPPEPKPWDPPPADPKPWDLPTTEPLPAEPEAAPIEPAESTEPTPVESAPLESPQPAELTSVEPGLDAGTERAVRTIAALEQWLDAIHVSRTRPRA